MATTIIFTCSGCSEEFSESVQAFVDAPRDEALAPALCRNCGHGDDDDEEWGPDSGGDLLEHGPR